MRAILFFVSVVVLLGIMHMVSKAASRKASRKASREPFEQFESCGDAVECQDGKHKHVVARNHNYKVLTHTACCDPGSYIDTPTAASSECTACPDAEGVPSEHYDKLTDYGEGMLNDANSPYTVTRKDTRRSCKTRCKVGTTNEGVWDKDREKYFMADGRQFMCKKYFTLEQVTDDTGRPYSSLQTYTWDMNATAHDNCPSGQTTVPEGAEPSEGDFCCTDFDNPSNLRISLDGRTTRCCENQAINVDGECLYCPTINKNDLLNTVTDISPIGSKVYTQQSGACLLSSADRSVCQGPTAHETKWRSDALRTNAGFTTYDRGCDVTVDKAVVMPNVNLFNTALHKVRYDEVEINAYAPTVQDQLEEKLFDVLDSDYLVFQPSGKWNNQVTSDSAIATNAYMMYAPGELSVANNLANALSLSTGTTIIDNLFACSNTNAGDSQFLRKTEGDPTSFGCCPSGTYLGGTGAQIRCVEPASGFEILDDVMVPERMTNACPVGFGMSNDACWPCADRDASTIVKQHGKWYSSRVGLGAEECTDITDVNTFSSNGVAEDIVVADIPPNTILGVGTPVDAVLVSENSGNSLKKMTANDYTNLGRGSDGELNGFGPTSATVYLTSINSLKTATVSDDASTTYLVHVDTSGFEKPVIRFLKNRLNGTAQNVEDLFFSSAEEYLDADGNDKRLVVTKIDRPTTNISPDGKFTDTSAIAYDFDIRATGGYVQVDLNADHREYLIRPTYSPDYVDTCVPTTAVNTNQNRRAYHSVEPNDMCSDCDVGSNVSSSRNHQCVLSDTNCGHSATNDVFAHQDTDGTWTCVSVEEDMAIDPLDPTGDLIDCRSLGFQRIVRSDGMISQTASDLTCDECPPGKTLQTDADGISSCTACPINTKQVGTNCVDCEIWESTGGLDGASECTACGGLSYRSISSETCDTDLLGNEYFSSGEQVPVACGENQIRSPLGTEPYVAQTPSQICSDCGRGEYLHPVSLQCMAFGEGDEGKKRDATDTTRGWSWCLANQVRNEYAENSCTNISDVDEYRGEQTAVGNLQLNSRKDTDTKSVLGYVECPANHRRALGGTSCAPCYQIDLTRPVRETGSADCRGLSTNEYFTGGNIAPQQCSSPDYVASDNWATGTTQCVSCTGATYKVSGANECRSLYRANEERRSCGENPAVSEGKQECTDLTKRRGTNSACCDESCGNNRARESRNSETCVTVPEGKLNHNTWCPVNQMRVGSQCGNCPSDRPIRGLNGIDNETCSVLPSFFHERDDTMTGTRNTSTTGAKSCDAHKMRTTQNAVSCSSCPNTTPYRPQNLTFCQQHPLGDSVKLQGNTWSACDPHKATSDRNRSTCEWCPPGQHRPSNSNECTPLTGNQYYSNDVLTNCPYHKARIHRSTSIYECDECHSSQYTDAAGNNCTPLSDGYGREKNAHAQEDCNGNPRTADGECQTCNPDQIWWTNNSDQSSCKTATEIGQEYRSGNRGTPFHKGYRLLAGVGSLTHSELDTPHSYPVKFGREFDAHNVRTDDVNIAATGTSLCGGRTFRNSGESNCSGSCATDRVLYTDGNTKSCKSKTDHVFDKSSCKAFSLSNTNVLDSSALANWPTNGCGGAIGSECGADYQRSGDGVFDSCTECGNGYRNLGDDQCQYCANGTYPLRSGSSTECVDFATSSSTIFNDYRTNNQVYYINTNNINNIDMTSLTIHANTYIGGALSLPSYFAQCPADKIVDPDNVTLCSNCPPATPIRLSGQLACQSSCTADQYYDGSSSSCKPLQSEFGWSKDDDGGRSRAAMDDIATITDKATYLKNKRYANNHSPGALYISTNHGSFFNNSPATTKEDCAHHCKYLNELNAAAPTKNPIEGGGCTYFKFGGDKCELSSCYDKRVTGTAATNESGNIADYGYEMTGIISKLHTSKYDTALANDYVCYRDDMCASGKCDCTAHSGAGIGLCKSTDLQFGELCSENSECASDICSGYLVKRCIKGDASVAIDGECYHKSDCQTNYCNSYNKCIVKRLNWGAICDGGTPCAYTTTCKEGNQSGVMQCLSENNKIKWHKNPCYASSECKDRRCLKYPQWYDGTALATPNSAWSTQVHGYCRY